MYASVPGMDVIAFDPKMPADAVVMLVGAYDISCVTFKMAHFAVFEVSLQRLLKLNTVMVVVAVTGADEEATQQAFPENLAASTGRGTSSGN